MYRVICLLSLAYLGIAVGSLLRFARAGFRGGQLLTAVYMPLMFLYAGFAAGLQEATKAKGFQAAIGEFWAYLWTTIEFMPVLSGFWELRMAKMPKRARTRKRRGSGIVALISAIVSVKAGNDPNSHLRTATVR